MRRKEMKKIAIIAAIVLFSVSAFAQVQVAKDGKITTYEKGSSINISSKNFAEVYYDGVLFTIPKGKRVVIGQNRAGNILIKGDNLNGVKVLGQTLKSEVPAIYIIDSNRNTVIRAPLTQATVADNKKTSTNKNNINAQNQSATEAVQETVIEVSFPEAEQFVNEIVFQQAIQDLEGQLSPSAPRI